MTKCIILAAGRGTRLHPYTANCPKCLTVLGGQPLIVRQLQTLRQLGIESITIVCGYRAEMLRLDGTTQVINHAWETTNMVESLFEAEALFTDDVIIAYSDIIYEPGVLNSLISSPSKISVVVDLAWRAYWEFRFTDPLSDAESLRMDDTGHITEIGNKVSDINQIQAQYIGLMRFRGEGIDALKAARSSLQTSARAWNKIRPVEKAFMTDLLMELILTGTSVSAVPITNGWLEIDTIKDYEKCEAAFNDGTINRFYHPDTCENLHANDM